MGRDIHPQILQFFKRMMRNHAVVAGCIDVFDKLNYIFRIERRRGLSTVLVYMSDAYFYTKLDYLSRPDEIGPGDFILIARPEAGFSSEALAEARRDCIGLGQIGKLMGALHHEEVWQYQTQEESAMEREGRVNWEYWRR